MLRSRDAEVNTWGCSVRKTTFWNTYSTLGSILVKSRLGKQIKAHRSRRLSQRTMVSCHSITHSIRTRSRASTKGSHCCASLESTITQRYRQHRRYREPYVPKNPLGRNLYVLLKFCACGTYICTFSETLNQRFRRKM